MAYEIKPPFSKCLHWLKNGKLVWLIVWQGPVFILILTESNKVAAAKWVHRDVHAQCCKWPQVLPNHVSAKYGARARGCGTREPEHTILANLLFPFIPYLQGLLPHSLSQSIFHNVLLANNSDPVFISCNRSSYKNNYIPNTQQTPIPGIICNSCSSPCPYQAREEPPTACGVPLSSMAKSSPPAVLVKLHESLQRDSFTPFY